MRSDRELLRTLSFDPAAFFIRLADGKPITLLRATTSLEALSYLTLLQRRGLLSMLPLDEANARFNVALTQRGLLLFDRVLKKMGTTVEKVRDVPKKPTRRPSA